MEDRLREIVVSLEGGFAAFLPKLIAGIALIGAGLLIGWIVKRVVFRMAMILNVDRVLLRLYRRRQLSFNNDVRYGIYNLLGNVGAAVVFLVFVDFAFIAWNLDILSRLIEKIISLLPRIAIAAALVGLGWLISRWLGKSFLALLDRENVPRPGFITLYTKVFVVIFFSALAAYEVDLARGIVTIAFTTVYVTMGIIAVLLVFSKVVKNRSQRDDGGSSPDGLPRGEGRPTEEVERAGGNDVRSGTEAR